MAVIPLARRRKSEKPAVRAVTDGELLELFEHRPDEAWDLFIDRYAGYMLSTLRHLGFDHDEAMDRFVFVCEKLCDGGFRRLRQVRHTGRRGELVPWLRTVVSHLSLSWARSVHGRRRLFRSIESLPRREQRVFELFFWQGLRPSEVCETLRAEGEADVSLAEVLDRLETLFEHLDQNQRWRLASRLARYRPAVPLESPDPETGRLFEVPANDSGPEEALLSRERTARVEAALESLGPRERLILQLRYEEALSLAEAAEIVSVSRSTVKNSLRASLAALRQAM